MDPTTPSFSDDSIAQAWDAAGAAISQVPQSILLVATVAALILGVIGSAMARRRVPLGGFFRTVSTLALCAILVTVVLQIARLDPRIELAVPELGLPEQEVVGDETRIPVSHDGHYWLQASVNGKPVNFLVDTGATLTAVSQETADAAALEPRRGGIPIRLNTANGTIAAQVANIDEMRFGNVVARGLDVVIVPDLGDTNVIGMNLLSQLKGWRVEDNTMILVPNHPQEVVEIS